MGWVRKYREDSNVKAGKWCSVYTTLPNSEYPGYSNPIFLLEAANAPPLWPLQIGPIHKLFCNPLSQDWKHAARLNLVSRFHDT